MIKKLSLLTLIALVAASCETEFAAAVVNQEKDIDNYLSANFSGYEVVRNGGSNRVVISEGHGEPVAKGDSVFFLFNGFVMGSSGPKIQFASDSAAIEIGRESLVKGVEDGIVGMKEGEEALILFTAEYGFGKEAVGLVPEQSALMYQIYINKLKKNSR